MLPDRMIQIDCKFGNPVVSRVLDAREGGVEKGEEDEDEDEDRRQKTEDGREARGERREARVDSCIGRQMTMKCATNVYMDMDMWTWRIERDNLRDLRWRRQHCTALYFLTIVLPTARAATDAQAPVPSA